MDVKTQENIRSMRAKGCSYKKIAKHLGISSNTVHTFCRRDKLSGKSEPVMRCKQCGGEIVPVPKAKPKKFCSDICRTAWWNSHLDQVNKKAIYEFCCEYCGKAFTAYGNAKRKFCSHNCYIQSRFSKERV